MDEQELLKGFKAVFKVCGLQKIVDAASKVAEREGVAFDSATFVNGLAYDCVEVVRAKGMSQELHPLFKHCEEIRAIKAHRYETEDYRIADHLPYGASSILTEVNRKVQILILQDKQGKLVSLEPHAEDIADGVNWLRFLWDHLANAKERANGGKI